MHVHVWMVLLILQHPLIDGDTKLFKQILELDNPNVIETLEYLVGM